MSIEKNLERIADALEIIAGSAPTAAGVADGEPSACGCSPVKKKTAEEKKAAKAEKAQKVKDAKAAKAAKKSDTTREDVQVALVEFCENGPGKTAGKEVLEEFKAGSISTLDEADYGAFVKRLAEVSDNAS